MGKGIVQFDRLILQCTIHDTKQPNNIQCEIGTKCKMENKNLLVQLLTLRSMCGIHLLTSKYTPGQKSSDIHYQYEHFLLQSKQWHPKIWKQCSQLSQSTFPISVTFQTYFKTKTFNEKSFWFLKLSNLCHRNRNICSILYIHHNLFPNILSPL